MNTSIVQPLGVEFSLKGQKCHVACFMLLCFLFPSCLNIIVSGANFGELEIELKRI